ncbi:flavin reductase [Gluconacetobacter azotocaptans]|nr:flavin reductase [Gluconacetobacter azotocaptans]MBM9400752.1 flavin reductase [Gluconacetobacter azotocaptans]
MSRLAGAVCLITTSDAGGYHGFTASSVCSVTDDPPTLLVCMNRNVRSRETLLASKVVGVNVLAGHQHELANAFASASMTMEQRFAGGGWQPGATGAPLLAGAAVSFDCRLSESAEVGTHSVLFCEIMQVAFGAVDETLLWLDRNYHRLPLRRVQI